MTSEWVIYRTDVPYVLVVVLGEVEHPRAAQRVATVTHCEVVVVILVWDPLVACVVAVRRGQTLRRVCASGVGRHSQLPIQ